MLTVIKLAPTIIFLFFVLLSLVGGLLRGFRKSLILFIHWLLTAGVGFVLFFIFRNKAYTMNLSFAFSGLTNVAGVNLSSAKTFAEAVGLFANKFLASYAQIIAIEEIQLIASVFVSIALNVALFIVFVVVIPFVLRLILRLFYILFYSESKHRRKVEEDGGTYSRHRLFGMLVGLVKGLICATLAVSLFSSVMFMAAGKETDPEVAKKQNTAIVNLVSTATGQNIDIALPAGLGSLTETLGALAETRSTGIGAIFEHIKLDYNGTGKKAPLDYMFFDLLYSSIKYDTGRVDEEGNPIQSRFVIREEIASLRTLLAQLADADVIAVKDGKISVLRENLETAKVDEIINSYIANSSLMSDLLPKAIVGFSKAIKEGYISQIPANIQKYFSEENVKKIEKLDFSKDLQAIVKVAVKGLMLLDSTEQGALDLTFMGNMQQLVEFVFTRDKALVQEVFDDFADIELVTTVLAPIAYGYGCQAVGDMTENKNKRINIALDNVNWKYEVSNFGHVYGTIVDLAQVKDSEGSLYLDLIKDLLGSSANAEAAAYRLAEDTETEAKTQRDKLYHLLQDMSSNDEAKEVLNNLSDLMFNAEYSTDSEGNYTGGSYLIGNTIAKFVSYGMINGNFSSLIGDKLQEVIRSNFVDENGNNIYEYYTEQKIYTEYDGKLLYKDVKDIINETMKAVPLVIELTQANFSDSGSLIKTIVDLKLDGVKSALIGERNTDGTYSGGLYELRLFSHRITEIEDGQEVKKNANKSIFDEIITTVLTQGSLANISEKANVDDVEDWRTELGSIIDAAVAIQKIEDIDKFDFNKLTTIKNVTGLQKDEQIDNITKEVSESTVLSSFLANTLIEQLDATNDNGETNFPPYHDKDGNEYSWQEATDFGYIYWNDVFVTDTDGNKVLDENGKTTVKETGEINHMLKAAVVFTKNIEETENLQDAINIGTLKKITDSDVDKLAASKVITNILPTYIEKALDDDSICDDLVTSEDWANELKSLIKVLNIEGLITDDNKVNLDVDTIASLKDDEVEAMAKSKILMKAIPSKLTSLESGSMTISIPKALSTDKSTEEAKEATKDNWKKWSYTELDGEGNPDYTTGEFYKVVNALRKAKEALNKDNTTTSTDTVAYRAGRLNDETAEIKLTTDNLMDAIFQMEHQYLLASDVLYLSISNVIFDQDSENIKYRAEAYTTTPSASDTLIISEDLTAHGKLLYRNEIILLLDTVSKLGIKNLDGLSNLDASKVLDKLDEVREDVCLSNILNITTVSKITTSSGDALSIPSELSTADKAGWYYDDTNAWDTRELAKLLLAIQELKHSKEPNGASIILNGNEVTVGETNTILKNLGEEALSDNTRTKMDVSYESDVFALTLSKKIEDQEKDGNVEVRDEAYDNSRSTSTEKYLLGSELDTLISFINDNNLSIDSMEANTFLSLIADTNPKASANKHAINRSNILNATLVSKMASADGITVPDAYKKGEEANRVVDVDNANWYYDNFTDEEDAEVYRLLDAIAAAGITDVNSIEVNALLNNLAADGKLARANSSDVFAITIGEKIREQETSGNISVRSEKAYDTERSTTKDLYFWETELNSLIQFISKNNLDVTSMEANTFLSLIADTNPKATINKNYVNTSNILNITMVTKVSAGSGISIPDAYKTGEESNRVVDPTNAKWYYDYAGYSQATDSEVYRLLDAIAAAGITDVNSIGVNSLLNNLAADGKLARANSSDVFAITFANKIREQEEANVINIRAIAYDSTRSTTKDRYFTTYDLDKIIQFINKNELEIENITADLILSLIAPTNSRYVANMNLINESNILNITFVNKATAGAGSGLYVPATYKTGDVININDEDWYYDHYANNTDSEVYRMLSAVSVSGLQHVNDVDITSIINNLKTDETKVETAYASDIFSYTISYKILHDDNLLVPETYKTYAGATEVITTKEFGEDIYNYISLAEIKHLIKATEILNIDFSNTANINFSSFLENVNTEVTKSVIVSLVMTKSIYDAGSLTIPDYSKYTGGVLVQSNTNTVPYFLYQEEVANVITAANTSGLDLNNSSSFDMSNLDSTKINALATTSNIFRATISDKITESITAPTKDYDGASIYDNIGSTTHYLLATEISAAFKALEVLGLDYGDGAAQLGNKGINELLAESSATDSTPKIDYVTASAIMLKELSKNLIDQELVVYEYPKTNTDNDEVAKLVSGTKYIKAAEIKKVLTAATKLGIGNVDDIQHLDSSKLYGLDPVTEIPVIVDSSIMSYLVSKLIIDNNMIDAYNYGKPISEQINPIGGLTEVSNLVDKPATAFSKADLETLLKSF